MCKCMDLNPSIFYNLFYVQKRFNTLYYFIMLTLFMYILTILVSIHNIVWTLSYFVQLKSDLKYASHVLCRIHKDD